MYFSSRLWPSIESFPSSIILHISCNFTEHIIEKPFRFLIVNLMDKVSSLNYIQKKQSTLSFIFKANPSCLHACIVYKELNNHMANYHHSYKDGKIDKIVKFNLIMIGEGKGREKPTKTYLHLIVKHQNYRFSNCGLFFLKLIHSIIYQLDSKVRQFLGPFRHFRKCLTPFLFWISSLSNEATLFKRH